ncbi:MAG: energy-coupling factor ABC transporter ATP-binding protein, partial [Elusimicrobia bacterium]|nr:energy-coupling factor ABC transporter ATP-binding protein [Elusimicrobiota bacterium]
MEVLRTENLCYKYEGAPGPFVLNDISLNIEKGEVVCIYGPNGSGKTTLLNTLCGLYKPSSGKVLLEGKDILGIDEKERFSKIGIVFQNPDDQLFSANVFQDIAFGPMNLGLQEDKVRERVDESLEIIGMTENRDSPVHTLSYGQKQKVAIAGVLAMRPEIILLDEPTSPLDPDSETRLLDFLKK